MTTTQDLRSSTSSPLVEDLDASGILAATRERKAAEDRAAADLLELAAAWADLHPPESIHSAASFTAGGFEHEEPIAGAGCPTVAEFCVAELGAVLGVSTTAAKRLIGHSLELRHRLPRLWAQVHAGRVPAWRARLVAEATIHATPALTPHAAGWVDTQVAAVAGKIGPAQLDRLVAEAIKRFGLAEEEPHDPDGWQKVDPRHVRIDRDHVHFAGTLHLEAEIDIADALDLDRALAQGAATRKALGSTASLGARRAMALGDLARTQTALDLAEASGASGSAADDRTHLPAAREVVLHAHFAASTTVRPRCSGRPGASRRASGWCCSSRSRPGARSRGPGSPSDPSSTSTPPSPHRGMRIPDRLREQVILRDATCVFPWCSRPARGCDLDHVVPFDHHAADEGRPQPGPTTTANLAALCRHHHRLKTHGAWAYTVTAPGVFEWTSPHGHRFHRDPTGTTAIEPPDPPHPPGRR